MTKQEILNLIGKPEGVEKQADRLINKAMSLYPEKDLERVITANVGVTVYTLFSQPFIETALENFKLRDQLAAAPVQQSDAGKALDLLSATLVETAKQMKGQELIDYVISQADTIIHEKYPGIQEKQVVLTNPITGAKVEGVSHEEFENVLGRLNDGENVLLVGPAGTGKNVICKQAAEFMGWEYYQANAVQQTYQLDGFIDANGKYQATEFYKACKSASEGKDVLFVFDEIDGSNPEVMVRFNDALSSFKLEFPTEVLDFHDHMHFIACANTWGTGASFEYVGRNQLDAATLDRWYPITIDYSPAIEEALCQDKELLEFCRAFRKALNRNHILHIVSYRGISRAYKTFSHPEMKTAKTLRECLTRNLEPNDLSMIVNDLPRSIYKTMVEELINE